MNDKGFADVAVPVLILLALVVVAYLGMWRGWRNRARRHDQGIAGTVVPPHGVLVVTWQHGDLLLDSGFRLDPGGTGSTTDAHDEWVRSISTIAKEHSA
jgi:hypothetical protein